MRLFRLFKIYHYHHLDPALERVLFQALATLLTNQETTMSKISEFADRFNAFVDRQNAAIVDLQGDINFLKEKIEELQNSPGQITPEDQDTLNSMEVKIGEATTKIEALANQTPPAVPPEPPVA